MLHVRNFYRHSRFTINVDTWKAKCPTFKAIVAGFRGKVALKHRTLGVPGTYSIHGASGTAESSEKTVSVEQRSRPF